MGAFEQLESLLQELLERPAWLLSPHRLQPLEIAGALMRELESRAVRLSDRIAIPTDYEILLARVDYLRLGEGAAALEQELAHYVEAVAAERDLSLSRAPMVLIRPSSGVEPAHVAVQSTFALPGPPGRADVQGCPSLTLLGRGGEDVYSVALDQASLTLGRGADNDMAFTDTNVSRHHARLDLVDGRYVLSDVGSTNGTCLNGVEIDVPRPLRSGDVIAMGLQRLRFQSTDPRPRSRP